MLRLVLNALLLVGRVLVSQLMIVSLVLLAIPNSQLQQARSYVWIGTVPLVNILMIPLEDVRLVTLLVRLAVALAGKTALNAQTTTSSTNRTLTPKTSVTPALK